MIDETQSTKKTKQIMKNGIKKIIIKDLKEEDIESVNISIDSNDEFKCVFYPFQPDGKSVFETNDEEKFNRVYKKIKKLLKKL